MAKYIDYDSWKLIEMNFVKKIYPVGAIISNALSSFNPNTQYTNTTWVRYGTSTQPYYWERKS